MSEHSADTRTWNERVIGEFLDNNGQVGGPFHGVPLLLMTTQGRKTGKPHTIPAVYLRDGARYLVFASNAGGPTNPHWYDNLLDHPQVTIEIGTEGGTVRPYAALAAPLEGDERDHFWERQCSINPAFRDYEHRTTRTIPVVALQVLDLTQNPELGRGMGEQLIVAHDTLRSELQDIRSQIDAIFAGEVGSADEAARRPSTEPADELHRSCLTYCYGLQVHHVREDGAFSALEDQFPQLTPSLDHLRAEHVVVERSLADFESFLDQGPPGDLGGVRALSQALDQVTVGLEEHFAYEEEHLLPVVGVARPPQPTSDPS
jgi:deazaflavin-dependent oxidoreductase (nitroreductase family)